MKKYIVLLMSLFVTGTCKPMEEPSEKEEQIASISPLKKIDSEKYSFYDTQGLRLLCITDDQNNTKRFKIVHYINNETTYALIQDNNKPWYRNLANPSLIALYERYEQEDLYIKPLISLYNTTDSTHKDINFDSTYTEQETKQILFSSNGNPQNNEEKPTEKTGKLKIEEFFIDPLGNLYLVETKNPATNNTKFSQSSFNRQDKYRVSYYNVQNNSKTILLENVEIYKEFFDTKCEKFYVILSAGNETFILYAFDGDRLEKKIEINKAGLSEFQYAICAHNTLILYQQSLPESKSTLYTINLAAEHENIKTQVITGCYQYCASGCNKNGRIALVLYGRMDKSVHVKVLDKMYVLYLHDTVNTFEEIKPLAIDGNSNNIISVEVSSEGENMLALVTVQDNEGYQGYIVNLEDEKAINDNHQKYENKSTTFSHSWFSWPTIKKYSSYAALGVGAAIGLYAAYRYFRG